MPEPSALQSINDMKIKAEIERVGIKEKLDQINAFVAEGDERKATRRRIGELNSKREQMQTELDNSERMATSRAQLFEHFAPLELANKEITVGPIEWVSE